ncbi:MAG: hypothetical protein ACYTF2_09645, partial [Planctomycetota bacterium]
MGLNLSLLAAAILLAGAADQAETLFAPQDIDPSVPSPASFLGHDVGARAAGADAIAEYFRTLDEASEYVTLTPYALTHEGRGLFYVTITSR